MAEKKYLDDVGTEYLVEKINDKIQPQFVGTKAEWEALSADEKAKFVVVNLTDDYTVTSAVVDEVTEGEGRAVSSGAVYDGLYNLQNTSVIYGQARTITTSENMCDWWAAQLAITIPDDKIVVQWFATSSNDKVRVFPLYSASRKPSAIGTLCENSGEEATIRFGAVVIDKV